MKIQTGVTRSSSATSESSSKILFRSFLLPLTFWALTGGGSAQVPVRFGIVLDGPSEQNAQIVETFQAEILGVLEGEFDASFSPARILTSDWTASGVRAVLDRLLSDPDVDQVLALGVLASNPHRSRIGPGKAALFGINRFE